MSSTKIQPLAALIAQAIGTMTTTYPIKVYTFDPGLTGLDSLPAAIVGLPDVELPQSSSQLGTNDWQFTFEVQFLFDLADPTAAAQLAAEAAEQYVTVLGTAYLQQHDAQIDPDGVSVIAITWDELVDRSRPMLSYTAQTQVLKLIP